MPAEELPVFRYHPDPLATGSVVASDASCRACGRARGYVYAGPVYSRERGLEQHICPWCIANGSARDKFAAEFVDRAGIGGYGSWEAVPDEVSAEVACRTPGFSGWQQERWFTCCGDAAAFLGPAGHAELLALGPQASEAIRTEIGYDGTEWEGYLRSLDKNGEPTAYLFRCLHCGRLGGYSDFG